jgi:HK97 gp10 family phage protein
MKNIKITGGRELAEALKQLPKQLQQNVMRQALRAGAKLIQDKAKELVPVDTGDLKKSIKIGTSSRRKEVRSTVATKGDGAYIARFVEFGTAPHIIKGRNGGMLKFTARDGKVVETQSVNHTGAKAKPFLRPALDGQAKAAIIAVGERIRQRLDDGGYRVPQPLQVDDV